jgi:hypothetical protein
VRRKGETVRREGEEGGERKESESRGEREESERQS